MRVQVSEYIPPPPGEVPELMGELLEWWNEEARALSPVLSSAIVHHRFEAIHPFADGNGRTGRATLRGLRISVAHVVNLVANGMSPAQVVAEHPDLEEEDIRQALAHAADLARERMGTRPA